MGHLETISHLKPIHFRSSSFHALCLLAFIVFVFNQPSNKPITHRVGLGLTSNYTFKVPEPTDCSGLNQHKGFENQCEFLKANPQCDEDGFFYYLEFFYCDCQNYAAFGYMILVIWLAALFYLLGNTSADYFCSCLEKLSNVLRLAPTVAGVTLLPLGNGAPDVFSSIAAFVGTDNGDVGLNSISGGAVFVICVVVGTISLCVAGQGVTIDRKCFVRDVSAFLFAIVSLAVILFVGEVNVGGAIAFVSIYVFYATFVAATEILRKRNGAFKLDEYAPLLPLATAPEISDFRSIHMLLSDTEDVPHLVESKVPHWMWGTTVAIYSDSPKPIWGWIDGETPNRSSGFLFWCSKLFTWLEFPLMLSRRLTIPIIEEDRWSKGYAVASVTLAPLLVAFVWNSHQDPDGGQLGENLIYIGGAVLGCSLGFAAYMCTSCDHPPQKMLLPWVLGGFLMSIIWFCMVADELVALLVAFGYIFRVSPSILGLTVLAWGNSMGDLMSNVALALNGADGVQIAISGCYAGPMFNVLVGLGISMLIGSWSKRPEAYIMSRDSGLFCNMGFIIIGLVWSLVVLPKNQMQPNKLLGMGLIGIYCVFLCLRIGMAVVNATI
ncbi:cation/calcium exchanger 4-like [Cynara cardunculus var. scolymus]|uniref:Sodium/calcium exchanger membrane region n=1 Tax=Cynara cardunculus var. scolymus TaxID=59895 RepID=A0A103XNG1_CYNCS|nr:cation/calcium exchanger 4-like [Cynara cardunculus var. scolymus]KVH94009.1 Sodium/calcium exchanger membrane region [Cynara cardunculus var. scolymus]